MEQEPITFLPVIERVDRQLIIDELTHDKYIGQTARGGNKLYEVTAEDSPNIMREIGRLREIAFRASSGGTGKDCDIDQFDIDEEAPYKQLIVWDPDNEEIMGGYRYLSGAGLKDLEKLATTEFFNFSGKFIKDYLPYTIELGRSFVQPMYQRTSMLKKGLYALDNLWDGLGALIVKYPEIKYFFGKVTIYPSYDSVARTLLLNFMNRYFPDKDKLVVPSDPLDFQKDNPYINLMFHGQDFKEGYKTLKSMLKIRGEFVPPLYNSYINVSPTMKVFGTGINYGFGSVIDTGILITIADMYPEKVDRHVVPFRDKLFHARKYWWWTHKRKKQVKQHVKQEKVLEDQEKAAESRD